ncbi:MAG: L-2-amino-thiazoline-4-carboxylic acid hydrolase [Betaproteobacteria bacterium]|nr:L-2-amino-thiazoline-4-carboxylic acid hydrolase [Betaproteobacteria bacterium]
MVKAYKIDSATAAIGEMARALQKKYGDEALEVIAPILREFGLHSGQRLAKKLADRDLAGRVEGWLEPIIKAGLCEVTEKEPAHVAIRGTDCPLNLEGTNRALCEACMSIDQGLVSALAGKEITLKIEKSMARGDTSCVVHFST